MHKILVSLILIFLFAPISAKKRHRKVEPKPISFKEANAKKRRTRKALGKYGKTRRERDPLIKEMTMEELKEGKATNIANGYQDLALKLLEQMILTSKDQNEVKQLRLELADMLFDMGILEKSAKAYTAFAVLYPGSKELEYANYRNILCNFYETLEPDRDQTKTKDTFSLAENFLKKSELFKEYNNDVENVRSKCLDKLLKSESKIFDFYLVKNNFKAAETRLADIKKYFEPKMLVAKLEPRVLYLEMQLAEKQDRIDFSQEKRTVLAEKYPEFVPFEISAFKSRKKREVKERKERLLLAKNNPPKRRNIDRF